MVDYVQPSARRVPLRALVLSLGALGVPVVGALVFPETLGDYGALLWLTALVPAFLLSYYRGWKGVATALAAGMATLSVTQAVAVTVGLTIPSPLLAIVMAYLAIALGIGWVTELLHRDLGVAEELAFTDNLTGLPNRRHARVFLENEFAAAQRGHLLSVALFDLDHFKRYNDSFGHGAGDQALTQFAQILSRNTRRMNLSARVGGEEFLAVLAGTDAEGGMIFAERIREALKSLTSGSGLLTVSGGIAPYHPSMRNPDELLAAADHALYEAKREGRDCIRAFDPAVLDEMPFQEEEGVSVPAAGAAGSSARETEDAVDEWDLEAPAAEEEPHDYPRPPEEMGKSRPPATLMPHRITVFGKGRQVMVVEDEAHLRGLLATYLDREGFQVTEASSVHAAMTEMSTEHDVVITDIQLPGRSGNELVRAVKSRWPATQVIAITGLREAHVAADAVNAGADCYLFKPFGMPELRSNLVDLLADRDRLLEGPHREPVMDEGALERERRSRESVLRGLRALVRAVEDRDPYTRGHGDRVARFAVTLADALEPAAGAGAVPRRGLELGGRIHDIGKIGVRGAVLNKPRGLSTEEFREVTEHPGMGRQILEHVLKDPTVLAVVTWHHERWNGEGYPDGLRGESIPMEARLVAVADALEAMTAPRAYREAFPWEHALAHIRDASGVLFDPAVVRALEASLSRLHEIHREGRSGRELPA